MSVFEFFLIISGFSLIFISFFGFNKKLHTFLRFTIFLAGISVVVFVISPSFLSYFASIFGLQRGADLLVYVSVVFLLYCILLLFKNNEEHTIRITKLVREFSLLSDFENFFSETILIIPVYNEEKIIEKTIKNIFDFDKNFTIIAINDGSSDFSGQKLKELSKIFPRLIVLEHSQNLGQGAGLETGFEFIRRGKISCDFVVTFDADGQMNVGDIPKMIDFLKKNSEIDIILGSRFLGKKPKNMPFIRKIILKLAIIFTKFSSGLFLTDSHNGFRVFRKNVLSKIYISINGMGHASEFIDIISREKIAFQEKPVQIIYTDYSLSKGQNAWNGIKIAMKIILKKFF